jgi:uncharacterized protein HemX
MVTDMYTDTDLKQPMQRPNTPRQPMPRQPIQQRQERPAAGQRQREMRDTLTEPVAPQYAAVEGMTLLTNWKCSLIIGLSSVACFTVLGLAMVMVAHIYAGGQVLAAEKITERAQYDSLTAEHESERVKHMVSLFKKEQKPVETMGCPVSPLYRVINGKRVKIC